MTLDVRRMTENFAAEIYGVDLSQEIDDALFARIHEAFIEHQVLVFRDQKIEPQHQIAFSRRFGPLEILFEEYQRVAGYPEVAVLSNEKVDGQYVGVVAAGDYWHSDQSYGKTTGLATFLFVHKLPKTGGDTEFADLYGSYECLPDDIKRRVAGRYGVHRVSKLRNPRVEVTREGGKEYYQKRDNIDDTLHPIVCTHPVSGRKLLYVSPRFTVAIDGMDDQEAQPLLDQLFDYQIQESNVYCHKWRLGDFVMWDNRCLNHRATGGYAMDDIRMLHRTTANGGHPSA